MTFIAELRISRSSKIVVYLHVNYGDIVSIVVYQSQFMLHGITAELSIVSDYPEK